MARISARLIGEKLGISSREVNRLLVRIGFLKKSRYVTQTGSPVWELTGEGEQYGEPSHNPYSNGHVWDREVIEILRDKM